MHVCIVTSGRPSEVQYGGEAAFIISLRRWLLDKGCSVTVVERTLLSSRIIRSQDSIWVDPDDAGSAAPRLLQLPPALYSLCMFVASLLLLLQVLKVNRESRISVIHAQDTGYGGLSAVLAARLLRLPVVVTSHGLRYVTLSKVLAGASARFVMPFEYVLDILTSRAASLIVIVGGWERAFFANLGADDQKIKEIPIGIKTSRFDPSKAKRLPKIAEPNKVVVAFIGRLSAEKNLLTLMKAFARAAVIDKKLTLLLVGSGPLEQDLRSMRDNENLTDRVVFMGIRHDIEEILLSIDIFTLISYVEGCPTSLLEAMASGRAIVASDIPSIREIVTDRKEALLVKPSDAKGLEEAILLLSKEAKLRNRIGRRASERSKFYDVDVVYPKIVGAYEDAIRQKRRDN